MLTILHHLNRIVSKKQRNAHRYGLRCPHSITLNICNPYRDARILECHPALRTRRYRLHSFLSPTSHAFTFPCSYFPFSDFLFSLSQNPHFQQLRLTFGLDDSCVTRPESFAISTSRMLLHYNYLLHPLHPLLYLYQRSIFKPTMPAFTPIYSRTTYTTLPSRSPTSATASDSANSPSNDSTPQSASAPHLASPIAPCALGEPYSHCESRHHASLRRVKLPGHTGKHALIRSFISWHVHDRTSKPRCRAYLSKSHVVRLENGTTRVKNVRATYKLTHTK